MVDHRFGPSGTPALDADQVHRIEALREGARLYARHVIASCPPSYERDKALESIDNAQSWAARGVARNE
jgi:hypothetical protein